MNKSEMPQLNNLEAAQLAQDMKRRMAPGDTNYDNVLSQIEDDKADGCYMFETIKRIDPKLAEQLSSAYQIVENESQKISGEDISTPENLGLSLYTNAYNIIKEMNEKFGSVSFNNEKYFSDRNGITTLDSMAANSMCAMILTKYAETQLDGKFKEFIVSYLQAMAKRDLLQNDSVPLSEFQKREGVDLLRSSSKEHIIKNLLQTYSPEELGSLIQELRSFVDQLNVAHNYPRTTSGRSDFQQTVGLAEDDDNYFVHEAYHNAGSFLGKGFSSYIDGAITELKKIDSENRLKKEVNDLLIKVEPELLSFVDNQEITETEKDSSKKIILALIAELKQNISYVAFDNADSQMREFISQLPDDDKIYGEKINDEIYNLDKTIQDIISNIKK